MKKIIIATATCFICFLNFAQTATNTSKAKHKKPAITFEANLLNCSSDKPDLHFWGIPENHYSIQSLNKLGYKIGATIRLPLSKHFDIRPSLFIVNKRIGLIEKNISYIGGYSSIDEYVNYTYQLELPIQLIYHFKKENGFYLGLGATVNYGLFGRSKGTRTQYGDIIPIPTISDINQKIFFDNDASATDENIHFKRWETGANFVAGYKTKKHLSFSLNYYNSWTNNNANSNNGNYFTQYTSFGLGYSL